MAPFNSPEWPWDFRLPRVVSINASGHKYGVFPGVGWGGLAGPGVAARRTDLQRELPRRKHADLRPQLLRGREPRWWCNTSTFSTSEEPDTKPGWRRWNPMPVMWLTGWRHGLPASGEPSQGTVAGVRRRAKLLGCQLHGLSSCRQDEGARLVDSAYTLPPHCEEQTVLRIVIRADFSRELADILLADFERALAYFDTLSGPMPSSEPTRHFAHL